MFSLGTTPKYPVYINDRGIPQLRTVIYRDYAKKWFLAFPPSYCTAINNPVYPNMNRTLWQPATEPVGGDIRLGNESTEYLRYPVESGLCLVSYDKSGMYSSGGINANWCSYQDGVFIGNASGFNVNSYLFVGDALLRRITHGTIERASLTGNLGSECFHLKRPTMPDQIPDELGNGQVTGGSSYIYLTAEILIEVPVNADLLVFAATISSNSASAERPAVTFEDFVSHMATLSNQGKYGCREARDFVYDGHRYILLEMIQQVGAVHTGDYLNVFSPYVYLHNINDGPSEYTIINMSLLFRAVDSIRSGAT